MTNKFSKSLWYGLVISSLVTFFMPLTILANNPESFSGLVPNIYMFYNILALLGASILFAIPFYLIGRFFPDYIEHAFSIALVYLVACGFYFPLRSGLLHGPVQPVFSVTNLLIVLTLLVLTIFCHKFMRKVAFFGLLGAGVVALFGAMPLFTESSAVNKEGFFDVATNRDNIFYIGFDALSTDTVKEVLERNQTLKKELDGFIAYKNVTSVAPFTRVSVLSSNLGFLPEENLTTQEISQKYYNNFITNQLAKSGYQVATYSFYNSESDEKTIQIPMYNISDENYSFYSLAVDASIHRYRFRSLNSMRIYNVYMRIFENTPFMTNLLRNYLINLDYSEHDFHDFNHFVEHMKPIQDKKTAHFHHHVFSHDPVTYDISCNYHLATDLEQTHETLLDETECSLTQFVKFLHKLKSIHAYDNSLIIWASDHGYECKYNTDSAEGSYKVNKRWCLSRYMPMLFIKPINSKGPLAENHQQVSLLDVPKTICDYSDINSKACKRYQGINLLNNNITTADLNIPRHILKTRVDRDLREYNDFYKIDVGRRNSIAEYFLESTR